MGHIRLGTLPKTRAWKEVIRLIADEADVAEIAEAAVHASDKAFEVIQNDTGFSETVELMIQLAVAAKSQDRAAHLESVGIRLPEHASITNVAIAIQGALDENVSRNGKRSDFGELAQGALVGAVVEHLGDRFGPMFPPTANEVFEALGGLGKKSEFGKLSRTFFGRITNDSLDYFLSKTIGAQVGEGKRFSTTNQVAQFKSALATHCHEASEIVERFSGDWLSKHHYETGGKIPRKKTEGFGWYAMQKMRDELKVRAKDHEPAHEHNLR